MGSEPTLPTPLVEDLRWATGEGMDAEIFEKPAPEGRRILYLVLRRGETLEGINRYGVGSSPGRTSGPLVPREFKRVFLRRAGEALNSLARRREALDVEGFPRRVLWYRQAPDVVEALDRVREALPPGHG